MSKTEDNGGRTLDDPLFIYTSTAQKELIRRAAREMGLTMSGYVRLRMTEIARKDLLGEGAVIPSAQE